MIETLHANFGNEDFLTCYNNFYEEFIRKNLVKVLVWTQPLEPGGVKNKTVPLLGEFA
jgi:hypothetical protein